MDDGEQDVPTRVFYPDDQLEVLFDSTHVRYAVEEHLFDARRSVDIATSDLETSIRRFCGPIELARGASPDLAIRVLVGACNAKALRSQVNERQFAEVLYGTAQSQRASVYQFRVVPVTFPFLFVRTDNRLSIVNRSSGALPQEAPALRWLDLGVFPASLWTEFYQQLWSMGTEDPLLSFTLS